MIWYVCKDMESVCHMISILELFCLSRGVQFPIIYSMYVGMIVDLGKRSMRKWD